MSNDRKEGKPEYVIVEVLPGLGQLNAFVKNAMKQTGTTDPNEAIRRVNSDEWFLVERKAQTIPRRVNLAKLAELAGPDGTALLEDVEKCFEPKWIEEDGAIYLTLPPTTGRTGAEWIARFENKISDWAKSVLRSEKFKPTAGVTYKIAILKGMLWEDNSRITKNIRKGAYSGTFTKGQKLSDPHAEVACLICDNFSNEEIAAMGLYWIVPMHEPIEDSVGDPRLLDADRGDGGPWLDTTYGRPDDRWNRGGGFAFVASQVSAQDSVAQA